MTDKELHISDEMFAIEFVRRLARPASRRTAEQMIEIVEQGLTFPLACMASDVDIERLYSGDNVYQDVFKFVRDNQHLFVDAF